LRIYRRTWSRADKGERRYRLLALVLAALRAAALLRAGPLVRDAFLAEAERLDAVRDRAAFRACRPSAFLVPAERPSRLSAPRTARDRFAEGLLRFFVVLLAERADPPFFGGTFTPARRALESPMAIACSGDRAPCFPSRT
jgi:hypothetical protein